jgi:N-acetylglucosaminyl-diphospho-decaprenol L-rhamnosyltransferase
MKQSPAPKVAAAVATYCRSRELGRLLSALQSGEAAPAEVYVADNASSEETKGICLAAGAKWLPRPVNNGPGAAWNAAVTAALADPEITQILVLDDDVVPPPEALKVMLAFMESADCGAVAPLLFDASGTLWGFPEPRERELRAAIRRVTDPDSSRKILGEEPHAFCWATGACMLYRRDVFEKCGLFREDFWMLGEDLEFSMRAAAAVGGVFTAKVAVPHLPPAPTDPHGAKVAHRAKFLALLQNLSFLAFRSPHSAHLRSYLPGNFRRYLCTEGWGAGTVWDGWCAFWQGASGGQPAGTSAGARIRERARKRMRKDRPE